MNLATKFKMGTSSINLNRNQSPDLSQAETGSPVFRESERYATDMYTEERLKGMTTQELISELLHSHSTSHNDLEMIRKEIKLRKARGENVVYKT